MGDTGIISYARAIESALAALDGRPLVLSPRDFVLISAWHARGVPIGLVLETIAERSRAPGRAPTARRALARFAPAVEETWEAVREGRASRFPEAADGPLPTLLDATASWGRTRDASPVGSPLRALLDGLLARGASGTPPEVLDAELDGSLPLAVPEAVLAEAETATGRELAPFRRRMETGVFEATRLRSVADRLRRSLGLPRLMLTRPEARPGK